MSKRQIRDTTESNAVEENSPSAKYLVKALDKAINMQTSAITGYVNYLRRKNPDASPAEVQRILDKHFVRLSYNSGAAVGIASAIPGIGFVTGALAIGTESLVFLDVATFYTMASAHVRGIDIRDPERRRTLILLVVLGSSGTALIDATVGDMKGRKIPPASAISRFSTGSLLEVNNSLLRMAIKRTTKRFRRAWLGKILPLGVGAVIGAIANRKLAKQVVGNSYQSLGGLPTDFPFELPAKPEKLEKSSLLRLSMLKKK